MDRPKFLQEIHRRFRIGPVVALLGPRQCGKTTLARMFVSAFEPGFQEERNYLDLEDPMSLERLRQPKLALQDLRGLVVIDEVQRSPELFGVLRVLADRPRNPARFLILGSASRDLIRQSSETLAGRISFLEVTPFAGYEVGSLQVGRLWVRGGFPPSYLAATDEESFAWREAFLRTFLEKDIPALGIQIPPMTLRRFWLMLAHYHGQIFNASEIGVSLGVSDTTASRYLDILAGTFMVRRLAPWHENLQKRQVKRPKLYFRDSGVLHLLLGMKTAAAIDVHPKLGASWEGFALEEVLRLHEITEEEAYFWGIHGQGELDLLLLKEGRRLGFEVQYTDRPALTPSLSKIRDLLRLDALTIVCPGSASYELGERVRVRGLEALIREMAAGHLRGTSQSSAES